MRELWVEGEPCRWCNGRPDWLEVKERRCCGPASLCRERDEARIDLKRALVLRYALEACVTKDEGGFLGRFAAEVLAVTDEAAMAIVAPSQKGEPTGGN